MPNLGNRKFDPNKISLIPTDIRNNCVKEAWSLNGKDMLGGQLDMIILGYDTGVGCVPPVTSYKQLEDLLKQNGKQVPDKDDLSGVFSSIVSMAQTWAILWFVPIFPEGSKLKQAAKEGKLCERGLYRTLIKSRSLDGTKTCGFWNFRDEINKLGKDLSQVIATPEFGTTHTSGAGTACSGLIWSHREARTDEEVKLMEEVQELMAEMEAKGNADEILTLPPVCANQFQVIPGDALRHTGKGELFTLTTTVISASLSGSDIQPDSEVLGAFEGNTIDVPMLPPSVDNIDEKDWAGGSGPKESAVPTSVVVEPPMVATTANGKRSK